GASSTVTVTIDTELLGLGEHKASICFESNDPVEPIVAVPVTLTVFGDVPVADISPTSFAFEVPIGTGDTGTLTIGSIGQLPLEWSIAEADLADCETTGDVTWLSASPAAGTTAPG